MNNLERMNEFFAARVDGYDEHMLNDVGGCKEGYIKMAQSLPYTVRTLLDLGCGTGLELDEIFKLHPDVFVTGIDMTAAMLDRIKKKHPDKKLELICGDYFKVGFRKNGYDCCVSFQTMHHFGRAEKTALYRKIYSAITEGGCYIECDYMAPTQEVQDCLFAENARIRAEQGIADGEFYHFDTPFTVENQIEMLKDAGFNKIEQIFKIENTVMLISHK